MTTHSPQDADQDLPTLEGDGFPVPDQMAPAPSSPPLPEDHGAPAAQDGGPDELPRSASTTESLIDHADVLAEFAEYESIESETIGENALDRATACSEPVATEDVDGEQAHLSTPKERLLVELRLEAKVEAVLFASQKPLKTTEILELLHDGAVREKDVQTTLDQLVEFYDRRCGGFKLRYLKRLGYQFQTVQEAGHIMERMFASRPRPISRAALETLAIIAYRQPATRAEVEFIRGVDAGSIFKTLLERELIKCVGRKDIVGRPMMFGTTDEFLKVFNLSSIKDLPPLESFQPSREMVQGALEKLEEGESPVDVEEYIAESTAAEYDSGATDDDWDESVLDESSAAGTPLMIRLQGATTLGTDDEDLSASPEEEPAESDHGTDPHSEMVIATGPRITSGGGELD